MVLAKVASSSSVKVVDPDEEVKTAAFSGRKLEIGAAATLVPGVILCNLTSLVNVEQNFDYIKSARNRRKEDGKHWRLWGGGGGGHWQKDGHFFLLLTHFVIAKLCQHRALFADAVAPLCCGHHFFVVVCVLLQKNMSRIC